MTSSLPQLEEEAVRLGEALGRVTAASIKAMVTSPPFAVSAMDGYAVRAADVPGNEMTVKAFPAQDSSMLAVLASANALLVRPAGAPAADAGEIVKIIRLDTMSGF